MPTNVPDRTSSRSVAVRSRSDYTLMGPRAELAMISLLIVSHVGHISGILDIGFSAATQTAFVIQYLIFALYGYVALMRGQWKIVAVSLAFVGYLIWQANLFQSISGQPMNINAALTYGTLLLALPLYQTRLPLGTILRILLFTSVGYLLLYIALAPLIASGSVESRIMLADDGTRGTRALLAGQFAAYVLFAGIVMSRQRLWQGLLLIAISGYAIFIAQSRMFQAVLVVTGLVAVIGTMLPFTRRPMSIGLALIFLIFAGLILWGYAEPSWNPYEIMMNDSSGLARYYEYEDARATLGSRYLTGVGIAPSVDGLQLFVKPQRPFFPGDIGPAGIFFTFGIIGATLFILGSVGCILSLPSRAVRPSPLSFALHYTALQAALYGVLAPVLFGGSGTLFGAFTFALWMKGGYFRISRSGLVPRMSEIDPNAFGTGETAPAIAGRRR